MINSFQKRNSVFSFSPHFVSTFCSVLALILSLPPSSYCQHTDTLEINDKKCTFRAGGEWHSIDSDEFEAIVKDCPAALIRLKSGQRFKTTGNIAWVLSPITALLGAAQNVSIGGGSTYSKSTTPLYITAGSLFLGGAVLMSVGQSRVNDAARIYNDSLLHRAAPSNFNSLSKRCTDSLKTPAPISVDRNGR